MIDIRGLWFGCPGSGFRLEISSLRVRVRERRAVTGPSGSGKTSLPTLVSGIIAPAGGTVRMAETDLGALSDARRREFRIHTIGFVCQDFTLLDYLNLLDGILHPCRSTGALCQDRTVRERTGRLAADLGVADKLKRDPHQLSDGERQRVAICRALPPGPRLPLADEVTGNLDPRDRGRILDLLFDSVGADGATLLAVTQDHELLPRSDRMVDSAAFQPAPET